ncbi:thermonuclease family protein [Xenophilus arseniciresistens]|uniref:Thermonuclease family protein n=1 Tax=Xenophilus arseniciresistens TaxID=1283306 RepID=A0AAE3SZJ2_9BURK|nr:thermonuclease family protein [Xenophilus arseniciresistens]MDA7415282.1 thermonuclease family protein [Xenophilus arseniciresistens]
MPIATTTLLCLVLAVQDGDSLRVRCDAQPAVQTVRLHAIDAPEHGQPWGRRARQALRARVQGQRVALHCVDTDAYGRRVCQVIKPAAAGHAAEDVGLAQIEAGLAWWYRAFSQAQDAAGRARYAAAEEAARARRIGLWQDGPARAVPPWRWRHEAQRQNASQ